MRIDYSDIWLRTMEIGVVCDGRGQFKDDVCHAWGPKQCPAVVDAIKEEQEAWREDLQSDRDLPASEDL